MVPNLHLNTGYEIPQIGLGLWQVTDEPTFAAMFVAAVEAGYRHFDSAQIYHNEHLLGTALQQQGLDRSKTFITTKIDVRNFTPGRLQRSFTRSLSLLQTEYIDLLLLHFPVPLVRNRAWQELVSLQTAGKVRSIGLSNFTIRHLEQLRHHSGVIPAVNQVELHVFLQQPELLAYCREQGIVVEAYSPLAHGRITDNATVQQIATKHNKSYAQVMLRWCVQQRTVVLPKSKTPHRLAQNIDIFDFELDDDDMAALNNEDANLRTCWSPVHVP